MLNTVPSIYQENTNFLKKDIKAQEDAKKLKKGREEENKKFFLFERHIFLV